MLAQLSLDQAPASGGVPISLIDPPTGERQVINQAQPDEMVQCPFDNRFSRATSSQSPLDLPAASRPGPQEAGGDLQGGLWPWRIGLGRASTTTHRVAVIPPR